MGSLAAPLSYLDSSTTKRGSNAVCFQQRVSSLCGYCFEKVGVDTAGHRVQGFALLREVAHSVEGHNGFQTSAKRAGTSRTTRLGTQGPRRLFKSLPTA